MSKIPLPNTESNSIKNPTPKFSGHDTFPCRYAWLPKAYSAVKTSTSAFADEELAMINLGLGKNMVRSLRFWMQATSVVAPHPKGGYKTTSFGDAVLNPKSGFDPFLEDIRTLWLIHWNLSTQAEGPIFAWDFLLNSWPHPELS